MRGLTATHARAFWQSGGGYDRNITSPKTLLRMIDYLHENPVRKKLVTSSLDWYWLEQPALRWW